MIFLLQNFAKSRSTLFMMTQVSPSAYTDKIRQALDLQDCTCLPHYKHGLLVEPPDVYHTRNASL